MLYVGISDSDLVVSGILNLDFRILGSFLKSGIPASIPRVVQHCPEVVTVSTRLERTTPHPLSVCGAEISKQLSHAITWHAQQVNNYREDTINSFS